MILGQRRRTIAHGCQGHPGTGPFPAGVPAHGWTPDSRAGTAEANHRRAVSSYNWTKVQGTPKLPGRDAHVALS